MLISDRPLKVIKVKEGKILVGMERFYICVDCKSMIFPPETQIFEIRVDDKVQLKEGDFVKAGIPGGKIVLYAFLLYIFPLIGLIGGLIFSNFIYQILTLPLGKIPLEFLMGFAGLFVLYIPVRYFDRYITKKKGFFPIGIKKVKVKKKLLGRPS